MTWDQLPSYVQWLLLAAIVIFGLYASGLIILNQIVRNSVIRMLDELPLDTWLSVGEIQERMRMQRWFCIFCVTLMRRHALIEARPKDGFLRGALILSDEESATAIADLFEYRLLGRRRKRRLDFGLNLRDLVPDPTVAHA